MLSLQINKIMKKNCLNNLSHNFINNYVVQQDGDSHILVPVVMMVEGVHNGSNGPMLYTEAELTASASVWNGFPIVVNHPKDNNGNYISVKEIDETEIVGTISNSHMQGNQLKAELRIEVTNLERLSAETMENIRNNRSIDVSIGIVSANEMVNGVFNSISYKGIVHNMQPDHLALLVGEEGACSWDDGCGIRNKKNNLLTKNKMKNEKKVKLENTGVLLTLNGTSVKLFGDLELSNNELGYREIGRDIQDHLNSLDTSTTWYYLEELFNDNFVYKISNSQSNSSEFYRKSYQVNASDELEITGDDATKVTKKVVTTFETVTNASTKMVRTNLNKSQIKIVKEMAKIEKSSSCKVDAVIANTANQFTQDDREFLDGVGDAQLDKFIPVLVKTPIENTELVKEAKVTEEQIQAVLNNVKDPEEFVDKFMPKGMRESVKNGIQLNNENRDKLVKGIIANSSFTEENLKSWSTTDLQKMHDSVVEEEPSNYSAQVINRGGALEATEDMAILLNLKKEEK